jgi:stage II sporulation protein D
MKNDQPAPVFCKGITLFALLFCLLFHGFRVHALELQVNLFAGKNITNIVVMHSAGRYILRSDAITIATLSSGDSITLRVEDDQIAVVSNGRVVAFGEQFMLEGMGIANVFSLQADGNAIRQYDDDLLISLAGGSLFLLNRVDLEKYVAGVVEAEAGGSTDFIEFFKAQAIVSRTYAMRLIHSYGTGYVLTDDVNNQVYRGKFTKPVIGQAVDSTRDMVIVYNDTLLINAVFHSNSGGATLSSADVWVTSLPYLLPVTDTFSNAGKNYEWSYSMPVVQWLNYLDKTFNYPVYIDSLKQMALNFKQESRVRYFYRDIPLAVIRNDLKLKSAFFSVSTDRDQVVFTGRGYGHGVGLSQEGAIAMAGLGYSAEQILTFYYSGVKVRKYSEL